MTQRGVNNTRNLSAATACVASIHSAVFSASSCTLLATYVLVHLQFLGDTVCHFFQVQFYANSKIGTFVHSGSAASTTETTSKIGVYALPSKAVENDDFGTVGTGQHHFKVS